MHERVREILGWYGADNPGTLTNLARLLNAGRLGGTGRLLILPVDQGFEHGPARSFAVNPPAYDPDYHFRLAMAAGCSAFAAPLGLLEAAARQHAGELPLILKLNGHDPLGRDEEPTQAIYGSVDDALRLGCVGVGYTIYPGSPRRFEMYDRLRDVVREAKARGLFVVVWSYPRGGSLTVEDETALDVIATAVHLAAELGAHVIKVKLPAARVAQPEARKVYEGQRIPMTTLAQRVHHVVQAAFGGKRVVIFSGGEMKVREEDLFDEIRAVRDGGGFGSIIGRNSFQRAQGDALAMLDRVVHLLSI